MQQSKSTNTHSQSRINPNENQQRNDDFSSGEGAARIFKYYRTLRNPKSLKKAVILERISAKALYRKHSNTFDKLAEFFKSHNIDMREYINFFVNDMIKRESDIDSLLYSHKMIQLYAEKLHMLEKRKKIYKWFMKSVTNIVDICITNEYMSGIDCMLALMRTNKLAQLYMTGQISKYFFAAIPNFKEIIPKLDHFAQAEFAELYDKFEIYNTAINDVFLAYKNITVNPIEIVNAELAKRRKTV